MSEWLSGEYSRGSFSQNTVEIQLGVVSQPIIFSLENPGDSVRGYKISIQIYENKRWVSCPAWISIEPNVFTTIYPAGRQDVEENLRKGLATIQLHPPDNLDWAARSHTVRVMVSTHETTYTTGEAQQVDYYEFNLHMPENYSVELRLEPEQQSGTLEDNYWLGLKNYSNTAVKLSFDGSDRAEMLQFSFDPPSLDLAEGAQGSVAVKLRAKIPVIEGESRSYHFSITARLEDKPQTIWQVNGSWLQQPITVDLSLTPESVSVPIGEDAIFTVQVINLSEMALTVQLEAVNSKGLPFFNFKPAPILLKPGQKRQETLQVNMKSDWVDKGGGKTSFRVIARVVEAHDYEVETNGNLYWSEIPPVGKSLDPKRIWLQWVGINSLGGLCAGVVLLLCVNVFHLDGLDFLPLQIILTLGLVGAVIGAAQWIVLHRYLKVDYKWIAFTAVGSIFTPVGIGIIQWLVLRRYVRVADRWILPTMAGWILGLIAHIGISLVFDLGESWYIIFTTVSGCFAGMISGIVLPIFIRDRI